MKIIQWAINNQRYSSLYTSIFSVAKATLESQMSVCTSVRQSQKPLSLSELLLLTIEPINH